jgi:hypothetical protein
MKLEFLASGSSDCPLIRLYEFDLPQIDALQQIALRLTRDSTAVVALHSEAGIQQMNGCKLTLRQGERDHGVEQSAERTFEWTLTKGAWLDVAALIQPFRQPESKGYQWLNRAGRIAVLLSHDGGW